jgi:serine/threonine protein kinase
MISTLDPSAIAGVGLAELPTFVVGEHSRPGMGPVIRPASEAFGSFVLTGRLPHHPLGERWLALDTRDGSSHTVYRLTPFQGRTRGRRAMSAVGLVARVRHPHLLPIDQFGLDRGGIPCLVTAYTGSHDGLVTLASLLVSRGGRLPAPEAGRAVTQLAQAGATARAAGLLHGALQLDDILIDRRGQLFIELYGLDQAIHGPGDQESVRRLEADEVDSLGRIGRTLFTGRSRPIEPHRARRLDIPPRWVAWLNRGVAGNPPLVSIDQAHAALPSSCGPPVCCDRRTATVKGWLEGLRRVLAAV